VPRGRQEDASVACCFASKAAPSATLQLSNGPKVFSPYPLRILRISIEQLREHDAGSRPERRYVKLEAVETIEARSLRLFRIAVPAAWVDATKRASVIACACPRFEGGTQCRPNQQSMVKEP